MLYCRLLLTRNLVGKIHAWNMFFYVLVIHDLCGLLSRKLLGRLVLMLASKSRNMFRSASTPLALALTVSLCAQALFVGPAQALSFISAKKSQLQTPNGSEAGFGCRSVIRYRIW